MASLFTYETEPIRLSSPWLGAHGTGKETYGRPASGDELKPGANETLSDYGISTLGPEPQEGPVEYKLHLMLRPRRSFSATSTVQKISGSYMSKPRDPALKPEAASSGSSTPIPAPSNVSRQHRLQHLTTQLLWRLQQSCPNHSSSASELVMPTLPEVDLQTSLKKGPQSLVGGIEETLGALYEIGVSDDGSFVGLVEDELEESLKILRAMAYSLGCQVKVLRKVHVGDCSWIDDAPEGQEIPSQHTDSLYVAEALVSPGDIFDHRPTRSSSFSGSPHVELAGNRQLRISLTGSTTSGKSSLLGTLSTSTLDNGRGKSRFNLLKHRHEIASGVTSSLAQELIGYRDADQVSHRPAEVINYASSNVSSWEDMHHLAQPGRLVLVTDSAGHPRFRRTTLRGLMSWAPDWVLCCVAADDQAEVGRYSKGNNPVGSVSIAGGLQGDLSRAHLELCLRLKLPLAVIITKLDLASKIGVRQICASILSVLKEAGRKPVIIPNAQALTSIDMALTSQDEDAVKKALASCATEEIHQLVPILLTSATTGAGIAKVHSLLHQLPFIRDGDTSVNEDRAAQRTLFHVDEVFSLSKPEAVADTTASVAQTDCVLSGHLRHGSLDVGQSVLAGPTHSNSTSDGPAGNSVLSAGPDSQQISLQSVSGVSGVPRVQGAPATMATKTLSQDGWHHVIITSIRYLRLPVRSLQAGQAATIGVSFSRNQLTSKDADDPEPTQLATMALRRGMVLLNNSVSSSSIPPCYTGFTAKFDETNTYVIPGSSVTIYIASIRTTARIVEVRVSEADGMNEADVTERTSHDGNLSGRTEDRDNDNDDFGGLAESTVSLSSVLTAPLPEAIAITFQFSLNAREWIELGTTVLVTPAGGLSMYNPALASDFASGATATAGAHGHGNGAALDGFVGTIVRVLV